MDIHIFTSVSESYIAKKNIQMIVQNIIQKTMFMEQHLDKYRAKHWENKIQRIKFGKLNSQKDLENYD